LLQRNRNTLRNFTPKNLKRPKKKHPPLAISISLATGITVIASVGFDFSGMNIKHLKQIATQSKDIEAPGRYRMPLLKRSVLMDQLRNIIKMMNRTIGDNSSFYKLSFVSKTVGQRG
jgi:hypothetical protein